MSAADVLQLGARTLVVDGRVLEVFYQGTSQSRIFLPGTVMTIDGPNRKGRHTLVVRVAGGHLVFNEDIEPEHLEGATRFAELVRAGGAS